MNNVIQKLSDSQRIIIPSWLRRPLGWLWQRFFGLACIGLVLFAAWINYQARESQWQIWQAYPGSFASNGVPLFSAADSGHFVNLANDYKDGVVRYTPLRLYPDNDPEYIRASDPIDGEARAENITKPLTARGIPMLSASLAFMSEYFFGGDTIRAGLSLIPICAFMTALAMAIMFWVAGYPIQASIAVAAFGISPMYFGRTAVGRVDTDLLIFFFFALAVSLVFLAAHQTRLLRAVLIAVVLGFFMHVFNWWYNREIFYTLLPALLFLSSFIACFTSDDSLRAATETEARGVLAGISRPFYALLNKQPAWLGYGILAAIPSLVMVFIMGPIFYFTSIWTLTREVLERLGIVEFQAATAPEVGLTFPDTYTTVDELVVVPFTDILQSIAFSPFLGMLGIIGFILWGVGKPSRAIVFLPYFIMGLLSVITARRFAVYASPFVWFGLAWLGLVVLRFGLDQINLWRGEKQRQVITVVVALAAMLYVSWPYIFGQARVPSPSFPNTMVSIFQGLNGHESIRNNTRPGHPGVIVTWWDYGYVATLSSGKAVLHDGGSQRQPRTHLVARSLVDRDLNRLAQTVKFLATQGTKGINDNSQDLATLNTAIDNAGMADVPIYIVVTSQVASWMPAIARLGLYNTVTGTSVDPAIEADFGTRTPECFNYDQATGIIDCVGVKIDSRRGTIDDQPIIRLVAQLSDGRLVRQQEFRNRGDWVLVLANVGGQTQIRLIKLRLWRSNYYQLMEVGVFDSDRLRLVKDLYPHGRVYELLR